MMDRISSKVWRELRCSYCSQTLERTATGAACAGCGTEYGHRDTGSLDLRLQRTRRYPLEFEVGTHLVPDERLHIEPLGLNPCPTVDYSNVKVPFHLTKEILSYFPAAERLGSLMLDLGCGSGVHRSVCEHAGFEWVGLDYGAPEAPILGDAHALPFADGSFDFVLSIAVLEHIRYPFVMMREAHRVLKPGGTFIGTVAFLEPFHGDSFYHHSHLGTLNSLLYGGFRVEKLAPSEAWSVLVAQATTGLFPKMPRIASRSIVLPVELLHKLWWRAGSLVTREANSRTRIRNTTGAFTFVAVKDA